MMYAYFNNIEEFNIWHLRKLSEGSYPKKGSNKASGMTASGDKQQTVRITEPIMHPENMTVVATVRQWQSAGLTLKTRAWVESNGYILEDKVQGKVATARVIENALFVIAGAAAWALGSYLKTIL